MLNQIKTKPCKADGALIAAVLLLFIPFIALLGFRPAGAAVEITTADSRMEYSLGEDETINISNEGFELTIKIENGSVFVSHADCPDKVCVRTGKISEVGEAIVCLPAKITVRVIGEENTNEDFIIR